MRITPYNALLNDIKEFCYKVKFRHTKSQFFWPKAQLRENWSLESVYERTAAASVIGYDTILTADDDGLRMKYVKKIPEIPHRWE